jgi:hypothetical protein
MNTRKMARIKTGKVYMLLTFDLQLQLYIINYRALQLAVKSPLADVNIIYSNEIITVNKPIFSRLGNHPRYS